MQPQCSPKTKAEGDLTMEQETRQVTMEVGVGTVRGRGREPRRWTWRGLDPAPEPQEEASPAPLSLAPEGSPRPPGLQNHRRVGLCCFQSLHLWSPSEAPSDITFPS